MIVSKAFADADKDKSGFIDKEETEVALNKFAKDLRLDKVTKEDVELCFKELDKDTSGVMVFAKSDAAYRGLVKIFSTHDLTRKYVAFVWGVPNWGGADITGNIARSSRNRQKMSMVKSGGKPAHTIVNVMDVWTKYNVSLFRCTLMTGRTHQIRVHLSAHGFPVLCDPLYGREKSHVGSVKNRELLEFLKTHNGQMLHAEILDFVHPITGEKMHFKSRMPTDMMELKEILDEE